jgi:hypothetical protein
MTIISKIFSTVLSIFAFLVISTTVGFADGNTHDAYINDSSHNVVALIHETAGQYGAPTGRYNNYEQYGVPLRFQAADSQELYVNNPYRNDFEEYEYTVGEGWSQYTMTAFNRIPLEPGRYISSWTSYFEPRRVIVQLDNNQVFQTNYTDDENSVYYITDTGITRMPVLTATEEDDAILQNIFSTMTHEPVNEHDTGSYYGDCR